MRIRTHKYAAFFMAFMLLAAGCAGASKDTEAPGDIDEETDDDIAVNNGDMITIGFSQVGAESDWRIASSESIRQAFSLENGYHLIFEDAQQRQENQTKAIREFIDQDVDYIILDPITETGWEASLNEAKEAGIPVILVDRRVAVEDESLYTAWVGADFYLEGQRACGWLRQWLDAYRTEKEAALLEEEGEPAADEPEDAAADDDVESASYEYMTDPETGELIMSPGLLHIVDIQGTVGASAQIGRTTALYDAIEANPDWELIDIQSGDFVQAKGREIMDAMLEKYGNAIDVVYCENDNMAYGAIEAIRAAGYTPGSDIDSGEIMVISFDATHQGLLYTLDGDIAVDTECTPDFGAVLSRMIQTLERGDELPKETYVSEGQFSSDYAVHTVTLEDLHYKVTILDEDIIKEREY